MKRKIYGLILTLSLCCTLTVPTYAVSGVENQQLQDKNIATISVKHLDSGETYSVEFLPSAFSVESVSMNSEGEIETTLGCEIFVDIQNGKISVNSADECSPQSNEGNYKEKEGVYAYLNVTYTISNDLQYIKTTNFNGRWELPNNLYYLSDRMVGIHQGTFNASNLQEKITTNSFNYNLNWPYENRHPNGNVQARAWSEATIWIAGMENSGGVALNIDLPYGTIE